MNGKSKNIDVAWRAIFDMYNIDQHDFDTKPFPISAKMIKDATKHFSTTGTREVRILCKQDSREKRPEAFKEKGLFLLPVKNGHYVIVKGEGYMDIPDIPKEKTTYMSQLDFTLDTSKVGDSEMQHLDFAYASSLIRTFLNDESLVLTIRGRKYTPKFDFHVGRHEISTESVQTEVDGGYEGRRQVVLIEAKNSKQNNTIIRQLYYPFRQWQSSTTKKVVPLFFEKRKNSYLIWQFRFNNLEDYNSIELERCGRFEIKQK